MFGKLLRRKTIAFLPLIALICAAIFSAGSVLAWFFYYQTGGTVSFSVGDPDLPTFHAWRYNTSDEASGSGESSGWVEAVYKSGGSAVPYKIKTLETDSGSEMYTRISLQLGSIDNLYSVENDNYFYIRLDVTDIETMGRNVSTTYSVSGVEAYSSTGNLITEDSMGNTFNPNTIANLFRIDAVVSTNDPPYEPSSNKAAIDGLFSEATKLRMDYAMNLTPSDMTDTYYVYIRIMPVFERIGAVSDLLNRFMPCEIIFETDLTIEFSGIYKS